MKNLITIMIMLVAVGCMTPAEKLRNSFVGSYEVKVEENTVKMVFLENGKLENYTNGKKDANTEETWKIVKKEVHVQLPCTIVSLVGICGVFKIESNGDLTMISFIEDGNLTVWARDWILKRHQITYKKLKE